jgi:HEAT repeat protein
MPRYISSLIVLFPLACGSPKSDQAPTNPAQASSDDVELAREFIEKIQKNHAYRMGVTDARDVALKEKLDQQALLRGSIELLKNGEPTQRKEVAHILGQLGDKRAVGPLVDVLADPSESLRENACYALNWLHAGGNGAEPVLVRLRSKDPSVDVRVAAAFALERPDDQESIAAFKAGIESTQKAWVRESCENQLEEIGKLELPLPEKVYTEISREKYEEIIQDRRWNHVRRKCKKGDILYLEVTHIHGVEVPVDHAWYWVKLD